MPEFVSGEVRDLYGQAVKVGIVYGPEAGQRSISLRVVDDGHGADLDREGALALIRNLQAAVNELPGAIVVNVTPVGYYETPGPVRFVRLGGDAPIR